MTPADWIALLQALLLLAAAYLSWRAYTLSKGEHKEARNEGKKGPLRALQTDVVHELKELAAAKKVYDTSSLHPDAVFAQQQRLAVALTFLPHDTFNLFVANELTKCSLEELTEEKIATARSEQLRLRGEIEDGKYSIRQVALSSVRAERAAKGDL